jgi:hypothetical protein
MTLRIAHFPPVDTRRAVPLRIGADTPLDPATFGVSMFSATSEHKIR